MKQTRKKHQSQSHQGLLGTTLKFMGFFVGITLAAFVVSLILIITVPTGGTLLSDYIPIAQEIVPEDLAWQQIGELEGWGVQLSTDGQINESYNVDRDTLPEQWEIEQILKGQLSQNNHQTQLVYKTPTDNYLIIGYPESINQLLHPTFDEKDLAQAELVTDNGLPASPGAATGHIVFDAETAKEWSELGKPVILVRHETSPEDIEGMSVSEAIVTNHGGMTSHAAVVARGMGKCCVAGCDVLEINEEQKSLRYPGGSLIEGDIISVDGDTGSLYVGAIQTRNSDLDENYHTVMSWANDIATVKVRMNAETPLDIQAGLDFGDGGLIE